MLNPKSMFPKALPGKMTGWLFFSWIIVLLFPLFKVFPPPMIFFGHPWKVEFISAFFLGSIILFLLLKGTENSTFWRKLTDKNLKNFLFLFLLFIFWSSVSAIWADSKQSVAQHSFTWFSYLVFFVLSLLVINSRRGFNLLIVPTAVAVFIISLLIIVDLIGIQDFTSMEGTFRKRYAKFAELLTTICPLLWALAICFKSRKKSYFFILVGSLSWIGVMFSLSKGAFISGVIGFVFFFSSAFLFSRKFPPKKILYQATLWLSLTLFIQIFFSIGSSMPATTDYISGAADKTRTTSFHRIFAWKVSGQMISDNLLQGVGANNFGLKFNEARTSYAVVMPNDEHNKIGEEFMFERSHNEFIQIFAELGIIGIAIFIFAFGSFLLLIFRSLKSNIYKTSPLLFACIAGILSFLISSLFSSFSFRAIQNGFVFFLVLAVLTNELLKLKRKKNKYGSDVQNFLNKWKKPGLVFCLVIFALFTVFSGKKGLSDYLVTLGNREEQLNRAESQYQKAIFLDPENAYAYFSNGLRLLSQKKPEKSISLLQKSIEHGLNVSMVYSYLTTARILAKDNIGAERTMAEAVKIFPQSVFARIRLSVLLEQNGKFQESKKQFEIAHKIDSKQANSWLAIIKHGSSFAATKAREDENYLELMSLKPLNAMYAIRQEENFRKSLSKKPL